MTLTATPNLRTAPASLSTFAVAPQRAMTLHERVEAGDRERHAQYMRSSHARQMRQFWQEYLVANTQPMCSTEELERELGLR
jgi:hypothetical protein